MDSEDSPENPEIAEAPAPGDPHSKRWTFKWSGRFQAGGPESVPSEPPPDSAGSEIADAGGDPEEVRRLEFRWGGRFTLGQAVLALFAGIALLLLIVSFLR